MSGLLFDPQDWRNELQAFQVLAGPLLDSSTTWVLDKLDSRVQSLIAHGGPAVLEIPQDTPLRTVISVGEFEPPGKNSGRGVWGEFTGKWEVNIQKTGKKGKKKRIEFAGLASTVVRIFDSESKEEIAKWKVDLGDPNSPGCYFHAHAGNSDFSLPVPRQPTLFVTPMGAMSHTLGELFQGRWGLAVGGASYDQTSWRSIQYRRLKALLNWKLEKIEAPGTCPWVALKGEKPLPPTFLD